MNANALGKPDTVLEESSNRDLLDAWLAGNEAAARVLVDRYLVRLTALARARLSRRLARRLDPEDIVLSAWRSFFVAARNGRVATAADDELWPLLVTFTLRKVSRQATRQQAKRRSIAREAPGSFDALVEHAAAHDPSPPEAAAVADEVEAVIAALTGTPREVFVRRLRGEDCSQIARELGCTDRTVRRAMERIRSVIAERAGHDLQPETAVTPPAREEIVEPPAARKIEQPQETVRYADLLLERLIGQGGFGKVYRAVYRPTEEVVAVKFLRKAFWSNPRAVQALLYEAALLAQLSDPRIVGYRGFGRTPHGAPYLVLEWIADGNLANWIECSHPPLSERLAVAREVAEAIAVVHARGILHCDLKPSNVLRRNDGGIVVTDFGFARETLASGAPRAAGGTAGFLAPEQVSDVIGPLGQATDVYGLGALMYSLLTGQPPVQGRDVPEILARVLSSQPPAPPSHLNTEISPALDAVVLRCLVKEPGERYATAGEVAAALRSCAAN